MDEIEKVLRSYGVEDAREKTRKMREFAEELRAKRTWAGLTSRRAAIETDHAIEDSLGVLSELGRAESLRVVDIGSGGGLLGVVLAIACGRWEVTLVESSTRKSAFLAEVTGKLELHNARVMNTRAEDLPMDGGYDAAVSRAAGSVADILPLAMRLLKSGGRYVAIKGSAQDEELEDVRSITGASGVKVSRVVTPGFYGELGADARTSLLVLEKL